MTNRTTRPPETADPRLGATLSQKYAINRLLGRGAFGAVYAGTNVELGKRVAIKLIEPEYAQHEEVVERFRLEARAAGRVESEHIVQVFDVGKDDEHGLYMVMELLVGEDLATRLDREFKLSPALATHIAIQAARGLASAHEAGVVHRDLKPANVFLCARADGSLLVKLVDFGISKILRERTSLPGVRPLTRIGTTVGTPNYMSPEQARGGNVDGRSDVWSLGAVLYEMLAGAPAFPHDLSYEETVIAIATGPEPAIADVAPWVPKELAAVVDRALTRDRSQRIPDCATFATSLAEAMPAAARPRREESLYLEPSCPEGHEEGARERPPRDATLELADDLRVLPSAGRQATTVSTRAATVTSTRARDDRRSTLVWSALFLAAVVLSAAAVAAAYRPASIEPNARAAAPEAEGSAAPSASPSAGGASPNAAPSVHPVKPKVTKPAPKPTATTTAKPKSGAKALGPKTHP